jgi:hypothetical protein
LFKLSLGERLLFVLLILVELLAITTKVLTVMVNNSTNINKTNNNLSPKDSLSSDGQQFYRALGERLLFALLILVEVLTITV